MGLVSLDLTLCASVCSRTCTGLNGTPVAWPLQIQLHLCSDSQSFQTKTLRRDPAPEPASARKIHFQMAHSASPEHRVIHAAATSGRFLSPKAARGGSVPRPAIAIGCYGGQYIWLLRQFIIIIDLLYLPRLSVVLDITELTINDILRPLHQWRRLFHT